MGVLTLKTLDPDVQSVEEYLSNLSNEEYIQLSDIANSDLSIVSDDELTDITTLSINIYSSEMEVDPNIIINDHDMINTIVKRFLTTVSIFGLIRKGFLEKSNNENMTLYKDIQFKPTEKGEIIGSLMCS